MGNNCCSGERRVEKKIGKGRQKSSKYPAPDQPTYVKKSELHQVNLSKTETSIQSNNTSFAIKQENDNISIEDLSKPLRRNYSSEIKKVEEEPSFKLTDFSIGPEEQTDQEIYTSLYSCRLNQFNAYWRKELTMAHNSDTNCNSLPFLLTLMLEGDFWNVIILSKPYSSIPLLKEKNTTMENMLKDCCWRKLETPTNKEAFSLNLNTFLA